MERDLESVPPEGPEADVAEQHTPVDEELPDETVGPDSISWEAPEADVAEQSVEVRFSEEDERG